jgi:hypothetical protein
MTYEKDFSYEEKATAEIGIPFLSTASVEVHRLYTTESCRFVQSIQRVPENNAGRLGSVLIRTYAAAYRSLLAAQQHSLLLEAAVCGVQAPATRCASCCTACCGCVY